MSSERYNVLHNKNLETVKSLRYSILGLCSYMKYLSDVDFVCPVFVLKRFNGSVDENWVGTACRLVSHPTSGVWLGKLVPHDSLVVNYLWSTVGKIITLFPAEFLSLLTCKEMASLYFF